MLLLIFFFKEEEKKGKKNRVRCWAGVYNVFLWNRHRSVKWTRNEVLLRTERLLWPKAPKDTFYFLCQTLFHRSLSKDLYTGVQYVHWIPSFAAHLVFSRGICPHDGTPWPAAGIEHQQLEYLWLIMSSTALSPFPSTGLRVPKILPRTGTTYVLCAVIHAALRGGVNKPRRGYTRLKKAACGWSAVWSDQKKEKKKREKWLWLQVISRTFVWFTHQND